MVLNIYEMNTLDFAEVKEIVIEEKVSVDSDGGRVGNICVYGWKSLRECQ